MTETKTYTVTFAPQDTAPAGELGKPDYFGFKVTAWNAPEALVTARTRFDKTFPHLADKYVATDVELTR